LNYHVITAVGTSLLRSYEKLNDTSIREALLGKPVTDPAFDKMKQSHSANILHQLEEDGENQPHCAELNSLNTFIHSGHEVSGVTLLPTATAEVMLISSVLDPFLKNQGLVTRVTQIQDLDYAQPEVFESRGLKNLVSLLAREVRLAREDEHIPIINGTAGFKAETAIMLLAAQFLQVDVFYMHERMERIVLFPNLPLTLNKERFSWAYSIIKTVKQANGSDRGVLSFSDFHNLTQDLDLSSLDFLFEKDDEFGGVTLSAMGALVAEGVEIEEMVTKLSESDTPYENRIRFNETEMPHAPKGTRKFMKKLARLPFIQMMNTIRYNPTTENRVKPKFDSRDPAQIQLVFSDGEKGIDIAIGTTARNQDENYHAKTLIAHEMSIFFNIAPEESSESFLSGNLLRSRFMDEIIPLAELESKAEEIIAHGENLTRPFENELSNIQAEVKPLKQHNTKLEQEVEKQKIKIKSQEELLRYLISKYNPSSQREREWISKIVT
jgi:putative CRISPR-associated protein (TIGR02619 family)